MGVARPTGDTVTLASLPPETGVTPADSRRSDWRAMLFFGTSAKGFRCLLMLQGTKNISHDEIRLKQEKIEELITHLSTIG